MECNIWCAQYNTTLRIFFINTNFITVITHVQCPYLCAVLGTWSWGKELGCDGITVESPPTVESLYMRNREISREWKHVYFRLTNLIVGLSHDITVSEPKFSPLTPTVSRPTTWVRLQVIQISRKNSTWVEERGGIYVSSRLVEIVWLCHTGEGKRYHNFNEPVTSFSSDKSDWTFLKVYMIL